MDAYDKVQERLRKNTSVLKNAKIQVVTPEIFEIKNQAAEDYPSAGEQELLGISMWRLNDSPKWRTPPYKGLKRPDFLKWQPPNLVFERWSNKYESHIIYRVYEEE